MFKRARKYAPAILFIDEIDAIGRTRTGNNIYSENDLKKYKQKFIEKSVYCMMRWLKFKKRKKLVTLIQKKINKL